MKKILIIAGIALLAASCVNNSEPTKKNGNEITFRTLSGTRFESVTAATMQEFSVTGVQFATYSPTTPYPVIPTTPQSYDFAYNMPVLKLYDSQTGYISPQWRPTKKLYWPANGDFVNFYAYSPVNVQTYTSNTYYTGAGGGSLNTNPTAVTIDFCPIFWNPTPALYYHIPDITESARQEDLMVAAALNNNKIMPGASAVALKFYHALSQVQFLAKNSMTDLVFRITDLKITMLMKHDLLSFNSVNHSLYPWYTTAYPDNVILPIAWSNHDYLATNRTNENYDATIFNGSVTVAPGGENYNVGGAVAVIPQQINYPPTTAIDNSLMTNVPEDLRYANGNQYIAVRFEVLKAGTGAVHTPARWLFLPINLVSYNSQLNPAVTDNRFVMGVKYTFVLDFDASLSQFVPVTFAVDVAPWEEVGLVPVN